MITYQNATIDQIPEISILQDLFHVSTIKEEDKKDGFHLTEINNRKDEISNSSGIGNIIEKSIVVAPNPVHDILTVKWNHYDENPLIRISLVTNDMRILFENTKVESSKRTETLYFTSYPPGIYYLVGYFYDGTKKTIKIIKN